MVQSAERRKISTGHFQNRLGHHSCPNVLKAASDSLTSCTLEWTWMLLNMLCQDVFVVVVDQFWHFIAAYELYVLFFSSVLSSCTLSHVASLRMRRIFNFLDRSPLADSSSSLSI